MRARLAFGTSRSGWSGIEDGEEELLRRLAEIRAAVTEGIDQAHDLNTLRLILRDLFASFELIRRPDFGTGLPEGYVPQVDDAEDVSVEDREQIYWLLPRLREPQAIGERGLVVPKAVLPVEMVGKGPAEKQTVGKGLATTWSPPRSSSRIR